MRYYSTNNKQERVSFKESLFTGMPVDKGLFMPEYIPDISKIINQDNSLSFKEISYFISSKYIENELSNENIQDIIDNSITFDAPNKYLYDNIYCLELFLLFRLHTYNLFL